MSKLYRDYIPANANIVVDYDANKPVKFSYPKEYTYWKAVWKLGRPTITSFWIAVNLSIFKYICIAILTCIIIYNISLIPGYLAVNTGKNLVTPLYEHNKESIMLILKLLGLTFYVLGIPLIVTYVAALNKNIFSTMVPLSGYKATKLIGHLRRKIFKVKDITKNKVILPLFENKFLHYKGHGDFGKQLNKIEIFAIPFNFSTNIKKYKEEPVEFEFSAIFYFKSIPKNGHLDVIYS